MGEAEVRGVRHQQFTLTTAHRRALGVQAVIGVYPYQMVQDACPEAAQRESDLTEKCDVIASDACRLFARQGVARQSVPWVTQ
jgi:hypothetical protein